MEKFYTIFCATDELHTSPAIQMFSRFHDIPLTIGNVETFTFILPSCAHTFQHREISLLYEADVVDLLEATVTECQPHLHFDTTLSLTLQPRDVGSSVLGIATPEVASIYSYSQFQPQFIKKSPMSAS